MRQRAGRRCDADGHVVVGPVGDRFRPPFIVKPVGEVAVDVRRFDIEFDRTDGAVVADGNRVAEGQVQADGLAGRVCDAPWPDAASPANRCPPRPPCPDRNVRHTRTAHRPTPLGNYIGTAPRKT